jgi:hypothetical protein
MKYEDQGITNFSLDSEPDSSLLSGFYILMNSKNSLCY